MKDTPETDAELMAIKSVCKEEYMLDTMADFARKLERERDEAITRRMETIMQCELYEQERDEARALLIRIYNDINVLHTGDAIRELTSKFRDENFN